MNNARPIGSMHYVEDLFTPLDDHSQFGGKKKFYKFIKHKKSDYKGVAALKVDGRLVNDSKGKADVLNQHFQSVFTRTSVTSYFRSGCFDLDEIR